MNLVKSDLNLMRKEWYNAFYNGDTEQLNYLEAEWFISTNGHKVIYKKHQLRKIAMRRSEQKGSGVVRQEYNVVIREFRGIACVSGRASLEEGDAITRMSFVENWIKINGGWKLQFVTFESG